MFALVVLSRRHSVFAAVAAPSTRHFFFCARWMLQLLKDKDGKCTYEEIVQMGEEKACDTVGAMLKILKNAKKIRYDRPFLMYPHHKNDMICLKSYKGSGDAPKKTKRKGRKKKKKKVLENTCYVSVGTCEYDMNAYIKCTDVAGT